MKNYIQVRRYCTAASCFKAKLFQFLFYIYTALIYEIPAVVQ